MEQHRNSCGKILALTVAIMVSAGSLQAAEILRFGHDQQKSHCYQVAGEIMAKQLKEATNGAYDVRVFPSATLGEEGPMLDGLISGNIDMAVSSASNAATHLPFLGMFSVSYLFEDLDHFNRTLNDAKFEKIVDDKIADANLGFHRISWFTAGVRNVYNNKKAIKTLADIQDMKIRVMASPVEAQVWSKLGTKPLNIPFSDVYTGLQMGVVEAAENAVAAYGQNKHYEVAPYYSLTGHQWLIAFLFVSDKTWNKLPPDVQKKVAEIGVGLTEPVDNYSTENDATLLKQLQKKYNVKVNDVQKDAFIDAVASLQDEVASQLHMEAALARIRELK